MEFVWDPFKAAKVLAERKIAFARAVHIFGSRHIILRSDQNSEERWRAIGMIDDVMITVIFTKRESAIRIITVRRAWKSEEREFHTHDT
jgi:uncharacterized protein